jgi:hypothetical protein
MDTFYRAPMTEDEIASRILRLAVLVEKDETSRAVLSTNERIAVALILDRKDWLIQMSWTILGAIDRLGEEWFRATQRASMIRRERRPWLIHASGRNTD